MRKRPPSTSLRTVVRVIFLMTFCVAVEVGSVGIGMSQTTSGIFVRSTVTTSTSEGGGSDLTLAQPLGMAAGDVLIAQVAVRGGTGLTLTAPSGWNLIRRDDYDGSIAQAIYAKDIINPSTEPNQYTWYFNSGNDAAVGLADYAGVDSVVANSGQDSASSSDVVAPTVQIPPESAAVTVIGFLGIAYGEPVVPPANMAQHWSFRANGWGIGIGMGDLTMTPGQPTGNQIGTASSAANNSGVLVVLSEASSATQTPTPTATPTPNPTDRYVSTNGNNSNDGTGSDNAHAWRTIVNGVANIPAGGTLHVEPGTYNETVSISSSGSAGNLKTVKSEILHGALTANFQLNANYWVIDGFDISNKTAGTYVPSYYGVYFNTDASHDTVQNNYIHELCGPGVYIDPSNSGATANTIQNNQIYRASQVGIVVSGTNSTVQRNEIWDMIELPSALGGAYASCSETTKDADGVWFFGTGHLIAQNYYHDTMGGSAYVPDAHIDAFQSFGAAAGGANTGTITIERNWTSYPAQWPGAGGGSENHVGIAQDMTGSLSIRNNIAVNAHKGWIIGSDNTSSYAFPPIYIYDNTFDNIWGPSAEFDCSGGGTCTATQMHMVGNIHYQVGHNSDSYLESDVAGQPAVSQNVFHMRSGGVGTYAGNYGSSPAYIANDPAFVDIGTLTGTQGSAHVDGTNLCDSTENSAATAACSNYHLQAGSPDIINGVDLSSSGVTVDYYGKARPSKPSVGAVQY